MDKLNVTLSLPGALLKRAKALALKEDKSFNELVRECLVIRLNKAAGYSRARNRQLDLMKSGFDLGTNGKIPFKRDQIHERR